MTQRHNRRILRRTACLTGTVGLLIALMFFLKPFDSHHTGALFHVRAEGTPTPAPIITAETLDRVVELRRYGRGPINVLLYSPDGSMLAAVTPLGIWLYRAEPSAQPLRLIPLTERLGRLMVWSPDGRFILTRGLNNALQLWSVETGMPIRTFEGHTAYVIQAAWSPDGRYIAASAEDGTLRFWEAETGRRIRTTVDREAATALAWSPDSRYVAAVAERVRIWEAETGISVRLLGDSYRFSRSVAWSPNGRYIAASGSQRLAVWNARTGELLLQLRRQAQRLAWAPDSLHLLFTDDGEAYQLELVTGREVRALRVPDEAAWTPDGERIAVWQDDGLVVRDTEDGETLYKIADGHLEIRALAWAPDGEAVLIGTQNALYTWDAQAELRRQSELAGGAVGEMAWSSDGRFMFTLSVNSGLLRDLRVWDSSGALVWEWAPGAGAGVSRVAWSPDGRVIAAGGWQADWDVSLLDAQTGEVLRQLGEDGRVTALAWSPDGRCILVGEQGVPHLDIWDVKTGKQLKRLSSTSELWSAAWSPDGGRFASFHGNGNLQVWDAQSYTLLYSLPIRTVFASLAWSPDGRYLSVVGSSGWLRIYDGETGALLREWQLPTWSLSPIVAWSPDGRYLLSGVGSVVQVWGVR